MSIRKPGGLGRGLGALLDEAVRAPATEAGEEREGGVREVDIALIRPNAEQPRRHFDEESLADLAASIAERGVLQPILLRTADAGFEIVAGERRWRAAQRAQLHRIPAIIRNFDDASSAEVALIENIQREDLNAIEEADGYRQLIQRHGHSQEGVAAIVHKSRSHVANLLRLLDLPEFVRAALLRGDISMGHARAIAASPHAEEIAREIIANDWTVRQAEARVRAGKPDRVVKAKPANTVDADLAALERQLGDLLGLKVRVAHSAHGGTVTLHYSSLDQLDMVCQRLSGEPI
ncbi:MAG TPA: ParB/RepB/Spo0J family partition protein [Sphingomicrobium sp.]|nr:ParB/RepB/Spo0J family partition protein [Sphingomicrobium sp.]